jgi:hypothetical protein
LASTRICGRQFLVCGGPSSSLSKIGLNSKNGDKSRTPTIIINGAWNGNGTGTIRCFGQS